MEQHSKIKGIHFPPLKKFLVVALLVSATVIMSSAFIGENNTAVQAAAMHPENDSTESVQAFMKVYSVLMSPRCMNCHPAGDIPLQGDDSHLHTMSPKRGKDGKGVYAMKCSNCHQDSNTPGLHTPPGNPNWHLPPADMKMVFQGRTPRQLAKQLVDRKQNGNKSIEQLIEHAKDTLVLAGWNPGEGRTLPPMPYEEFATAWNTWLKKGAYAPK